MANMYRVELEDDEFEIIAANTDEEAIIEATATYEFFYNIVKLDDDYNEVETIF